MFMFQFKSTAGAEDIVFDTDAWFLLYSTKTPTEDLLSLQEVSPSVPKDSPCKVVINK
ncbi:hypothetical protein DPMN_089862 [Dreissena polymorpha]|uniref:Uncharacterized protein n=1 Tax=Dreissena polymorpha TaxID=45954 RepID=A0A9D4KWP5_DREPO|nr:hypothetical protein DPMN_089862 [Dreissena polymorpha]